MTSIEIQQRLKLVALDHNLDVSTLRAIPKEELVIGQYYLGECRNASIARWDGKHFVYTRHKFGGTYEETINHYEDDDGYDVFVPVMKSNHED